MGVGERGPRPRDAAPRPGRRLGERLVRAWRADPHLLGLAVVYFGVAALCLRPDVGPADGIGYFAYLQSAFVDGDLSLHDEFLQWHMHRPFFDLTDLGHVRNRFAIGAALLWLPFAVITQAVLWVAGARGAHVTEAQRVEALLCAAAVGTSVYGYATLVLCHRIATRFVSAGVATLSVAAIWVLTPLWHYSFFDPLFAHTVSAFAVALALYLALRMVQRDGVAAPASDWFVLGAAVGIATAARWQNAALCVLGAALFYRCALLPIGAAGAARRSRWRADVARLASFGVGALLGVLPQLVYWRMAFGSWLALPQGEGFLRLAEPQLGLVLLSSHHSLYGWSPILAPATLGLALLWRRARTVAVVCLLLLGVQVYVNSIAGDVFAGVSFGARRFIALTPVFCLGLAVLLARLPRIASALLVALAAGWTVPLWLAFHHGLFDRARDVPYNELASAAWRAVASLPNLLATTPRFDGLPSSLTLQLALALLAVLLCVGAVRVCLRLPLLGAAGASEPPPSSVPARRGLRVFAVASVLVLVDAGVGLAASRSEPAPVAAERRGNALLLDLGWYANARYDFDPFLPKSDVAGYRPVGVPQTIEHRGVPYRMPRLSAPARASTIVTTCGLQPTRVEIELRHRPSRALHFAVIGGALRAHHEPLASLRVEYADGTGEERSVLAGRDVWDFDTVPPPGRVIWRDYGAITAFALPLRTDRVPRRLVLQAPITVSFMACFAVAALTQELGDAAGANDERFVPIDLSGVANADHRRDSLVPTAQRDHFPDLHPGWIEHEGTPFRILDADRTPTLGSVVSTAYWAPPIRLPLVPRRSDGLSLLVDAALARPSAVAGRLRVEYRAGPDTTAELRVGRDVSDYWQDAPAGRVAWKGAGHQDLARYDLALDPKRVPRFLWLEGGETLPDLPNAPHAGIAVFAVTQRLARPRR